MKKNQPASRRKFLKTGALAAGSAFVLPRFSIGQLNPAKPPLRLAVMGLGGITFAHATTWAGAAEHRHLATLLCDPDKRRMDPDNPSISKPEVNFPKSFPGAIRTDDYRKAFEQYGNEFDAVLCCSTDHHHFGISKLALDYSKPVYCEKPVCWSPHEGMLLRKAAAEAKLPTQMGNQGNSANGWRVAHAYYQNGHLGDIVEVHGWIRQKAMSAPLKRFPSSGDLVPDSLDWAKYCGPAGDIPFKRRYYHPAQWRWWLPFGGGFIGDWGCHVFGGLFKTLEDLGYPSKVEVVRASEFNGEQFPLSVTNQWTFPARNGRPELKMYFHTTHTDDPAFDPPRPEELEADKPWPPSNHGCVWKGTKGTYVLNAGHNNSGYIIPEQKRRDIGRIEQILPKTKGNMFMNQGEDWVAAVRGEKEWHDTVSNFDYGAHLSTVVQMGNAALRAGHAIGVDPNTGFPLDPRDAPYFTRQNPDRDWYDMLSRL
jgi:predicted dehydrogenase